MRKEEKRRGLAYIITFILGFIGVPSVVSLDHRSWLHLTIHAWLRIAGPSNERSDCFVLCAGKSLAMVVVLVQYNVCDSAVSLSFWLEPLPLP